MLDTKQSWDDLVLRHAPDEETAYRILENRLYHNLTARFVQSHDYIAMERLFEIHATGEYDLIVIDTPPTRNAIDFLDAPARMADFFGGRLLRWLTLPYRVGGKRGTRVINVASRPFYQMADRILGSQFLAGHRRVLPQLPVDVRRVRRARAGGRAAAARQAHDVRGRHHARSRAAARGRDASARELVDARLPPRRAGAQQDAARLPASTRRRARGRRACVDDAGAARATRCVEPDDPALADRDAHRTRAAHGRRVVPNFSVVAMREAELRAELAAASPTSSCASRVRGRHQRRRRPRRASATCSSLTVAVTGAVSAGTISREHARRAGAHRDRALGEPISCTWSAWSSSWRPLADLSFADLLLLAPIAGEEGHRFVVLAQVRPVTGQTNYPQDLVGHGRRRGGAAARRPVPGAPARSSRATRRCSASKERVRVQCIPVRHAGPADRAASPARSR